MSTETAPLNIRVHLPGNAVRIFPRSDFEAKSEDGVKHEAIGRYNRMMGIISVGPDHTGKTGLHSVAPTSEPVTVLPPVPRSTFDERVKAEAESIQKSAMAELGLQIGKGIKEALAEMKAAPSEEDIAKLVDARVDAEIARRTNASQQPQQKK
jgi:hypothetical protein